MDNNNDNYNKQNFIKKDEVFELLVDYTNIIKDKDRNINQEKEYSLEDFSYEKLCEIKHEEIISTFRMGYSVQERIIDSLNKEKKFKEYPNLLFYLKNTDNLYYKEIDRVLFLLEKAEFQLFKTYLSIINNKIAIKEKGCTLKLDSNTLNFVEIKRSINSFDNQISEIEKKKNIPNDKKDNNSEKDENISASKNSFLNKEKTDLYYSIKNIKVFLDLFKKIGLKYSQVNLLYIFDSQFSLNFIEILMKLIKLEINDKILKLDNELILNLYFIHIESDYEKLDIINREKKQNLLIKRMQSNIKKIENENKELKEKFEKNENENKELKERFENENKELKERFENENKELKEKFEKNENENKELKEKFQKYEKENKELKEKFQKYEYEKLIKNTIKNIPIKEILEEENLKSFNILIGKNYHNLKVDMQINDANQMTDKCNNKIILDIKTFFLKLIDNNNYSNSNSIYYNSYFSMINDCKTIILLIDHDFINNFEYLKKNYLEKYKIKVIIVELSVYIAILENIKKKNFIKGDEQDKDICTVKIKDNNILPGFKKGEYKFHLDNNLVTYFKKLQKFKTNISKKINDEILIYFPDNMTFQYLIKYIYIDKNKNDDFIIINDENNLNNLNILSINLYSIKEIINSYNCKNNLYFIPIEFNDNTFSKIKEYFPHNITDELKYGKEISGFGDYIFEIIKNNKNDYFLKLLHSKKIIPLYM